MATEGDFFANIPYGLQQLVLEIMSLVYNDSRYTDCVLFLDSTGMIGLAPAGIRVNDTFVRFQDTQISAIIRQSVDGMNAAIGRARHLTYCKRYIPPSQEPLEFWIDLRGLDILTRTSFHDPIFRHLADYLTDVDLHREDFKGLLNLMESQTAAGTDAVRKSKVLREAGVKISLLSLGYDRASQVEIHASTRQSMA